MARFFKRGAKAGAPTRAETTAPAPGTRAIEPDPSRIGISGSVPFLRLPDPARLFAARAERFAALAPGHPLEAYLGFLGRIAEAQARVQIAMPAEPAPPSDLALRAEHGMPALSRGQIEGDPAFPACLDALLAAVDLAGAPPEAAAARDALRAASPEDRLDLAVQVFEGALPVERLAECVFAAAALQVFLAASAARLDASALKPVADGVCPACGSAPTASLIVGWTPADKARYLACSACGTLWNHVRIRCTACGSGEDVSYYSLDEGSGTLSGEPGSAPDVASGREPENAGRSDRGDAFGNVQVEACGICRSYLKHLHQHRDPALDPIADDVASYGLDLKIGEDGFRKAGLNLLFVS